MASPPDYRVHHHQFKDWWNGRQGTGSFWSGANGEWGLEWDRDGEAGTVVDDSKPKIVSLNPSFSLDLEIQRPCRELVRNRGVIAREWEIWEGDLPDRSQIFPSLPIWRGWQLWNLPRRAKKNRSNFVPLGLWGLPGRVREGAEMASRRVDRHPGSGLRRPNDHQGTDRQYSQRSPGDWKVLALIPGCIDKIHFANDVSCLLQFQ